MWNSYMSCMWKGVSKQSRLLTPIRKDVELIYAMYVERSFKTIKASNSHTKGCGTHICHVCGKEFQEKRNMESHMQKHTENFKCQHCSKCFESNAKLNRHLVVHDKFREVNCQYCQKSFSRMEHLKEHINKKH